MGKKKGNGITAWSPSRLADYEACPAKLYHKVVERLPDPGSPAMDRGTAIHKIAEEYVAGLLPVAVPDELRKVAKEVKRLRKAHKAKLVMLEAEVAFDRNWKDVEWRSPEAWLRTKVDVIEFVPEEEGVVVTDWKTGDIRASDADKHGDQLNLYSLVALVKGWAERATARLGFIDHGKFVEVPRGTMEEANVTMGKMVWERRVLPMFTDTKFAPTPNYTCRWCAFSKAKGGPCRF